MYPLSTGIPCTVFARVPDTHRRLVKTAWADANRGGDPVDCFLEGPSFDRAGNLYVVDIPFGRVFRVSPSGEWTVVTEYDGWPNGLKVHRDGRIFITDYKRGIMLLDPASGKSHPADRDRAIGELQGRERPRLRRATATSISPTRGRRGCTTRRAASIATRPRAGSSSWSARCRARTGSC